MVAGVVGFAIYLPTTMAADDIMEGFQIWGNEFKDYLPMSRHPCNPRGLEIGSPIIVAIITSPRAISVGNAIFRWQSWCNEAELRMRQAQAQKKTRNAKIVGGNGELQEKENNSW